MGNHHISLPAQMMNASAAVLLISLATPGAWAAEKTQGGVLPDVLIQAEENRPVQSEKPAFNPAVKEDTPLEPDLDVGEDVKYKLPSQIAKATVFVPDTYNSPRVAVPSTNWIMMPTLGEPVRVFYPMKELLGIYPAADSKDNRAKGQWELSVIDDSGKAFKKLSGVGLPPDHVDFDGRGDEGGWLRVGQIYLGLLTYHDASSHVHTAMGKSFALAGLSVDGKEGPLISLAPKVLFDPQSQPARLSAHGKELLSEAAQIIQRYHPGLSLRVTAYLSRPDGSWAQSAAETCAKELSGRLLLGPSMVESLARPSVPDSEQRVDVLVVNR